jgi:hypothetical protein
MKTLDRSKPFGEVFGISRARYEQDHVLFDAQGHALADAEPAPEPVAKRGRKPAADPAAEPAPEPAAPTAADAQLDAQLQG